MNKIYLLNVGKALNVKKPETNWLHKNRLEEEGKTTYQLILRDSGKFLIASTSGDGDSIGTRVEMYADQSGRFIDGGEIIMQFDCKDVLALKDQIITKTNKASLSYYVYK